MRRTNNVATRGRDASSAGRPAEGLATPPRMRQTLGGAPTTHGRTAALVELPAGANLNALRTPLDTSMSALALPLGQSREVSSMPETSRTPTPLPYACRDQEPTVFHVLVQIATAGWSMGPPRERGGSPVFSGQTGDGRPGLTFRDVRDELPRHSSSIRSLGSPAGPARHDCSDPIQN